MSSDPKTATRDEPRTVAGRDLLASMYGVAAVWTDADFAAAIVAVEDEAARFIPSEKAGSR